jgi:pantetheine-phosphate adenylyltransferase
MLKKSTEGIDGIKIRSFSGLLMDFAVEEGATALVRGLRTISDFDYEFRMAALNKRQNAEIETIFIMAGTEYSYISSSAVKEIGLLGGNITQMVPGKVLNEIETKFKGDLK